MATLPAPYDGANGRLFFAELDGEPAGCVGVRSLPDSEGVGEMKTPCTSRRKNVAAVSGAVSPWLQSRRPRNWAIANC